jgi:hypothetical protein
MSRNAAEVKMKSEMNHRYPHPNTFRLCGFAALLCLLPACSENFTRQLDPYQRDGAWHPAGVNEANLADQVANPNDLIRGRHARTRTPAEPQVIAIDHVMQDQPKPLANGGASGPQAGGAPGNNSGGNGASIQGQGN